MSDSVFKTSGNGSINGLFDTSYSGELIIPEYIGEEKITKIGSNAFYNCSSLASVTIPDSVTSIGRYAFRNCSSLASVTIPDSVTNIELYAFNGCTSLTKIYVSDPNNLSSAVSSYAWSNTGSSGVTFLLNPLYTDYLVKGGTLINLADKIRILNGIEDNMTPAQMDSKLGDANNEVDTQSDLIDDIVTILNNKLSAIKPLVFEIRDLQYEAKPGMSWERWCQSKYNTAGFYVQNSYIYNGNFLVVKVENEEVAVFSDDLIVNGRKYYLLELEPLLTFSIDQNQYEAKSGMSWEEWCNSSYNTDGFYIKDSYIYSSDGKQCVNDKEGEVTPNDLIVDNMLYKLGLSALPPLKP